MLHVQCTVYMHIHNANVHVQTVHVHANVHVHSARPAELPRWLSWYSICLEHRRSRVRVPPEAALLFLWKKKELSSGVVACICLVSITDYSCTCTYMYYTLVHHFQNEFQPQIQRRWYIHVHMYSTCTCPICLQKISTSSHHHRRGKGQCCRQ